jgi:hypothetical protein
VSHRSSSTNALLTSPAFLVNADVEPIKSVPVAIFKGTDDDMMTDSALDEVRPEP